MFRWGWRILLVGGFAGLAGCHSPSWPAPQTAASCNDPCATMTCPEGTRCSSDSGCHAQCQPEYPPAGFKP
ncbi:MAG TPA: hypothetical protein VHO67_08385 [Polyangia bacterium]|nr:hypothetical protein [Polyangia bacterium]